MDPYLDPETGLLRNLVGANTPAEPAQAEADLVAVRIIQLEDHRLVHPTRDIDELRGLHKHLFQHLFSWAGDIRTTDMKREPGQFCAPCAGILLNLEHIFTNLRNHYYLQGLAQDTFTKTLARFYDDLNYIHHFREGNGRTQRLFWSRVAFEAGWVLNWAHVHGDELDEVSRLAREDQNLMALEQTFAKCILPI